jgi:hypothetical protein
LLERRYGFFAVLSAIPALRTYVHRRPVARSRSGLRAQFFRVDRRVYHRVYHRVDPDHHISLHSEERRLESSQHQVVNIKQNSKHWGITMMKTSSEGRKINSFWGGGL